MKRRYGALIAVVVLATLATVLLIMGNQRSEARIVNGRAKPWPQVVANKQFSGAYARFTYNGTYQGKQLTPRDNERELYYFTADTNYQKNLTWSVEDLPAGGVTSLSADRLRASQPENYTGSTISVAGGSAQLWQRHDGTEMTIIIPHGTVVATLSFTAQINNANLQPEVEQLLNSYRWN